MMRKDPNTRRIVSALFIVFTISALLTTTSANAIINFKELAASPQYWWLHPVLTLSGGAATSQGGQTQTLTMVDDLTIYQYNRSGGYSSSMIWGGFIGTEIPLNPAWRLQAGLGYYQPSSFSPKGILLQGVDAPSTDQFTYGYHVKTLQLLVEGKLLWHLKERFNPYFSFGMGPGFNQAYGYTTNVPPLLTFTPQFTTQNNTTFTYAVGAGIDIDILKNLRFGVGYRFTDLGKANLGAGYVDTTPFTPVLNQSNLYTQEVVGQLTYLVF